MIGLKLLSVLYTCGPAFRARLRSTHRQVLTRSRSSMVGLQYREIWALITTLLDRQRPDTIAG